MTTTKAAAELEVSGEFVRGEIRAGRMKAKIIARPGKRPVYRITPDQLAVYMATYWKPDVPRSTISQ